MIIPLSTLLNLYPQFEAIFRIFIILSHIRSGGAGRVTAHSCEKCHSSPEKAIMTITAATIVIIAVIVRQNDCFFISFIAYLAFLLRRSSSSTIISNAAGNAMVIQTAACDSSPVLIKYYNSIINAKNALE